LYTITETFPAVPTLILNEVDGENLEKKVEQLNSAIADVRKQLEELGQ